MLRTVSASWTMSPLRYRSYRREMYLGTERDRPVNLDSMSIVDHRPSRRSTPPVFTPIMLPTTSRRFDFWASSRLSALLADVDVLMWQMLINRRMKKTHLINARIPEHLR